MNIKDYAQYYIGCRCLNTWYSEGHIHYDNNWRLTSFRQTGINPYGIENEKDFSSTDSIKLILRRLEDISDDEWSEIEYATSIMEDTKGLGLSKYAFLKGGDKDRYHWTITNELLIELRKRSVDVDGLIKAGLAVDIKTLPK